MRAGWGLLLLLGASVLGGCRVDAFVEIDVSEAGGEVTARFDLDREAMAILGGRTAAVVEASDLEAAGWKIAPVDERADGGAGVVATRTFHRAADLAAVIGELAGPAGPLRDFRLDRDRGLLETRYRLRGTADLGERGAAGAGLANSPQLAGRLRAAGVDPARVEELLTGRAADGLHLEVRAGIPGRTESRRIEPGGAAQSFDLTSTEEHRVRPALLVVAVVLALVAAFRLRRQPPQS